MIKHNDIPGFGGYFAIEEIYQYNKSVHLVIFSTGSICGVKGSLVITDVQFMRSARSGGGGER